MSGSVETFYTSVLSPFGSRLRLVGALTKRDLGGITLPPGGTGSAEMKAINPFGQVPTLVVDGTVLIESLTLMEYFLETGASSELLPADPLWRARIRGICSAHDHHVVAAMVPVFGQLRAPNPDLELIAVSFRQIEQKLAGLASLFDASGFIIGHALTLADIAIVPFANLVEYFAARFSQTSPYASQNRLIEWSSVVQTVPEISAERARLNDTIKKILG